jgi:Oxysterol-binding protein.
MVMRKCQIEVYVSSYCVFIFTARVSSKDDVTDEEDLAETSLVLVEDHKSVILHLLSQLKLGMDLTQVVLPTFILEKRSLLEMFADCMGHPQLFVWSVSFFRESYFVVCSIHKSFGEINLNMLDKSFVDVKLIRC